MNLLPKVPLAWIPGSSAGWLSFLFSVFLCSKKPENFASWTYEDWLWHVVERLRSHSNLRKMAARSWFPHNQNFPARFVALFHLAIYKTCSSVFFDHKLPKKQVLNLNETEPKHTQYCDICWSFLYLFLIERTRLPSRVTSITQWTCATCMYMRWLYWIYLGSLWRFSHSITRETAEIQFFSRAFCHVLTVFFNFQIKRKYILKGYP